VERRAAWSCEDQLPGRVVSPLERSFRSGSVGARSTSAALTERYWVVEKLGDAADMSEALDERARDAASQDAEVVEVVLHTADQVARRRETRRNIEERFRSTVRVRGAERRPGETPTNFPSQVSWVRVPSSALAFMRVCGSSRFWLMPL
jgi:hypothetical protein